MTGISIGADVLLADLVAENYRTATVLQAYGMDFCCNGKRSLAEVCAKQGVALNAVLSDLEKLDTEGLPNSSVIVRFNEWEADFLVDFIIANHHQYTKRVLPILAARAQKVAKAHGNKHPELLEISERMNALERELTAHLYEEEQVLFPYVKKLMRAKMSGIKSPKPFFGSAQTVVADRESEHTQTGEHIHNIRRLSNNFLPPDDACNTYKVLFQELQEFEQDVFQHIHLENNLLFPRIIALEHEVFGESLK